MDNQTSGQAASLAGDAQPNAGSIASVSVSDDTHGAASTSFETDGADTKGAEDKTGKELRLQKKSEKEWQQAQEKAAAYDRLVSALAPENGEDGDTNADPVELIQKTTSDLQAQVDRLTWERKNLPQNISDEAEKKWEEACKRKADPNDSWHKLSYDEILNLSGINLAPVEDKAKEKADEEVNRNSFDKSYGRVSVMKGVIPPEASDSRTQLDNEVALLAGLTKDDLKLS